MELTEFYQIIFWNKSKHKESNKLWIKNWSLKNEMERERVFHSIYLNLNRLKFDIIEIYN